VAFVDLVEIDRHVFDLLKEGGRGAGVNFDDFAAQFVFLLEDEAGVIGGVFEFGDDDPLDGDAETLEDIVDEIVGEGALPMLRSTWMTNTFCGLPTKMAHPLLAGTMPRISTFNTSFVMFQD
jgi:hypothetical protein